MLYTYCKNSGNIRNRGDGEKERERGEGRTQESKNQSQEGKFTHDRKEEKIKEVRRREGGVQREETVDDRDWVSLFRTHCPHCSDRELTGPHQRCSSVLERLPLHGWKCPIAVIVSVYLEGAPKSFNHR